MPMWAPSTVTLMADVTTALLGTTLLGTGASMVMDAVRELICQPVVITNRRSVQMPAVECVVTVLSDTQIVASLRVPPRRDGEL